jgi:hypothetical protein
MKLECTNIRAAINGKIIVDQPPNRNFTGDFGLEMVNTEQIQNELSRTIKIVLDSGEAKDVEEAERIFKTYRLRINVGADITKSSTLQAMLLTVVNTARRCFLGGVEIASCPDGKLLVPWKKRQTIKEAIIDLGGSITDKISNGAPEIFIGNYDKPPSSDFAIRATFDGWIGAVTPARDLLRLNEKQEFTPAGVLAGSLAVSEAFQFVRGKNAMAGKRVVGLSLWNPAESEWWNKGQPGPMLKNLPSRLWLIGLGHLGQAYLWTLGFLPYAMPSEVELVLQDVDTLVTANDSTSPLTFPHLVGQKKTRAMAAWCEQRGFRTLIDEHKFQALSKMAPEEPKIALCGVDNFAARAVLENAGFSKVIEAGLGKGGEEYLAFQVHSFPGKKKASELWKNETALNTELSDISNQSAYKDLESRGLDKCGLTTLAGRSVGASFVGTFVSTIVIAEVLRMIAGGPSHDIIDGTLRSPENFIVIEGSDLPAYNPGITHAT